MGIQSREVLWICRKSSLRVCALPVFSLILTPSALLHAIYRPHIAIAALKRTAGSERSVDSRGLKCEVSTMCNVWFTLILVHKKGLCFGWWWIKCSCHTGIMLKLFALLQALWLAACPSSGELTGNVTGKGWITLTSVCETNGSCPYLAKNRNFQ